jgi:homoserine kinase
MAAPQVLGRAAAFAPATVANLGPGFDILGMAVEQPGDTVWAELVREPGVSVVAARGAATVPMDPLRNTAAVAAAAVLRIAGRADLGVRLEVDKGLPVGSGLGSSGASAVAAAWAVREALGLPLSTWDLFLACCEAEAAACGAAHGDNVAPALYGGAVLLVGQPASQVVPLPVPDALHVALCTPEVEVQTSAARAAMPRQVPLGDAVFTASQVASLVGALYEGDLARLGRAIEDRLHVPVRSAFIPGYALAREAALAAGALAFSVSGSGPTVFALTDSRERAATVASAIEGAFASAGLASRAWASKAGARGARVVPFASSTGAHA